MEIRAYVSIGDGQSSAFGYGNSDTRCMEDVASLVELLKVCAKKKDLCTGSRIHVHIANRGLHKKSPYVASSLIHMYAKCGVLAKARQVLEDLPARDVVSWSALITGYAHEHQGHEAFDCYCRMRREGIYPNRVTFISILKVCSTIGAIEKGEQIHDEIVRCGLLDKNITLGTALVNMYVKCGSFTKARHVLEDLPVRNGFVWSALLTGYAREGRGHEALLCFEEMQKEGHPLDWVTFASVVKACGSIGAIDKGKEIHDEIVRRGLLVKHIMLGNALVDMYCKCSMIAKARQVLEELPIRNVVTWSTLISGYIQMGQAQEALNCLDRMQREGQHPNDITFICILKACGSIGDVDKGEQIHDAILNLGLLDKNIILGNALINMYTKCDALGKAEQVLEKLPVRDVVSWNSLIAGYVQKKQYQKALGCFSWMQRDGLLPTEITFVCILTACGNLQAVDKGKQIHFDIINRGMLEKNIILSNALVDMYVKCGFLEKAHGMLDKISARDVVTWNALIAGYAHHEKNEKVFECFAQMQREGLVPDGVTFTSILKACGGMGAMDAGKLIHDEVVSRGLIKENIVLGTALVDMYAKCGLFAKAHQVLEDLDVRDVVSWSALIAGCAQGGHGHEALNCFVRMQKEGIAPNEVTFTSVLQACGSIGAIDEGKQIHESLISKGLIGRNALLSVSLIDMYVNCGAIERAREVVDKLVVRDTISWSALICGYAKKGHFSEALLCFKQMEEEGISPNEITFVCVLAACCHSGKSIEAQSYYENISAKYGLTPTTEHHTCMVAIFGVSGQFDKAMSVIQTMPSSGDPSVWLTLLASCRKWGNVGLGSLAFDQIIQMDSKLPAAFVLMASVFAVVGMQEDAEKVLSMRNELFFGRNRSSQSLVNLASLEDCKVMSHYF